MTTLDVHIPGIVLKSINVTLSNASMHDRFCQASTARKQRADVTMVLSTRFGKKPPFGLPVEVTVTRFSPGELDKHDNLPGSAKHVVDAIAKWFGHEDKDSRFTWKFAQAKDRNYGIGIRIIGGRCGKNLTCACCESRLSCILDKGHSGECSFRGKATG